MKEELVDEGEGRGEERDWKEEEEREMENVEEREIE